MSFAAVRRADFFVVVFVGSRSTSTNAGSSSANVSGSSPHFFLLALMPSMWASATRAAREGRGGAAGAAAIDAWPRVALTAGEGAEADVQVGRVSEPGHQTRGREEHSPEPRGAAPHIFRPSIQCNRLKCKA